MYYRKTKGGYELAESFSNDLDTTRMQFESLVEYAEDEEFYGPYGMLPYSDVIGIFDRADRMVIQAYNAAMDDDERKWKDAWDSIHRGLTQMSKALERAIRIFPPRDDFADELMEVDKNVQRLLIQAKYNARRLD